MHRRHRAPRRPAQRLGGAALGHRAAAREALRPHPHHRHLAPRSPLAATSPSSARRVGLAAGRAGVVLPLTFDYRSERAALRATHALRAGLWRRQRTRIWTSWPSEMRQLVEASRRARVPALQQPAALERRAASALAAGWTTTATPCWCRDSDMGRIELLRQFPRARARRPLRPQELLGGRGCRRRGALAGRDRQAALRPARRPGERGAHQPR